MFLGEVDQKCGVVTNSTPIEKSESLLGINPLIEDKIQIIKNRNFGKIRGLVQNGIVFLFASDIAKALGYKRPQSAIKTHCNTGDTQNYSTAYVPHKNKPGGTKVILIGESNLYRLIMGSKLEKAEIFQNWVYTEVLPSIRRTGGYIPVKPDDDDVTIMARALQIANRTLEQKDVIIEEKNVIITQQQEKIEEYEPMVEDYRLTIGNQQSFTTQMIGPRLGASAQRIHAFLFEEGIVEKKVRSDGTVEWHATAPYRHFQTLSPYQSKAPNGKLYNFHFYPKWTREGRQFVIDKWEEHHGKVQFTN